ncbi:MAG: type II toxin-antitoxin system HicA family toxin [Pseudomonadota bacterium]|nr:type II toxin-antitoxin system HicA family toxin [Pseudomonadota bacterium]
MARLPNVSAKDLIRALEEAGFLRSRQKGSHVSLRHPGTKRTTVVPMHTGDLKRSLLKKIIQDAGLTEDDFRDLL